MAVLTKSSPYQNSSSPWFIQAWTTTPADRNLLLLGPGGDAAMQYGYACRRISIQTAGTLVVTRIDGTVVTLTCYAGEVLEIEATALSATSTAQGVKVFW
jgi:hypothetical protein